MESDAVRFSPLAALFHGRAVPVATIVLWYFDDAMSGALAAPTSSLEYENPHDPGPAQCFFAQRRPGPVSQYRQPAAVQARLIARPTHWKNRDAHIRSVSSALGSVIRALGPVQGGVRAGRPG